eukprot:CAMPEP_0184020646 /NCGR_PEP_ID=MMETSP0954-20121128/9471_1 /TAXON_ID=627963 /ORGANISM="Aplanochytrium sp, Strain PBS07" /LENGTH=62 /DNA_ID=CAMNT_0026302543 /DNA_START=1631 /DNA_END=1819 /DNA_ORIENTATION=+
MESEKLKKPPPFFQNSTSSAEHAKPDLKHDEKQSNEAANKKAALHAILPILQVNDFFSLALT